MPPTNQPTHPCEPPSSIPGSQPPPTPTSPHPTPRHATPRHAAPPTRAAPLYLTKTKLQTLLGTVGPDGRYLDGPRRGHLPAHRSLTQSLRASFREASAALRSASHGGAHGGGAIATLRSLCALWDCGGTTLLVFRGAAISCGQLTFYDLTKRASKRRGVEEGPLLHMGASVVAAFWATTLSLPFDVLLGEWTTSYMLPWIRGSQRHHATTTTPPPYDRTTIRLHHRTTPPTPLATTHRRTPPLNRPHQPSGASRASRKRSRVRGA